MWSIYSDISAQYNGFEQKRESDLKEGNSNDIIEAKALVKLYRDKGFDGQANILEKKLAKVYPNFEASTALTEEEKIIKKYFPTEPVYSKPAEKSSTEIANDIAKQIAKLNPSLLKKAPLIPLSFLPTSGIKKPAAKKPSVPLKTAMKKVAKVVAKSAIKKAVKTGKLIVPPKGSKPAAKKPGSIKPSHKIHKPVIVFPSESEEDKLDSESEEEFKDYSSEEEKEDLTGLASLGLGIKNKNLTTKLPFPLVDISRGKGAINRGQRAQFLIKDGESRLGGRR